MALVHSQGSNRARVIDNSSVNITINSVNWHDDFKTRYCILEFETQGTCEVLKLVNLDGADGPVNAFKPLNSSAARYIMSSREAKENGRHDNGLQRHSSALSRNRWSKPLNGKCDKMGQSPYCSVLQLVEYFYFKFQ